MTGGAELSAYWTPTLSARFWLVASLFYLGVLVTHFAFVLGGECGFAFVPGAQSVFVTMIGVLLLGEWWAWRRFRAPLTRGAAVAVLVAHMVLFEVTSAVDCTATTTVLYLLVPFIAYLLVGKWTGIALATLYAGWFVTYFAVFRVDPFSDFLFRAVTFGLAMSFSLAMASLVRGVLERQVQERRLHGELEAAHRQLAAQSTELRELGAAAERNRLARDIHDSVGHYLAAVTVQLEKALAFGAQDPAKAEQAIRDAKEAAREALRDVRRSVGTLREGTDVFSLTSAVRELARRMTTERLAVDVQIHGDETTYSRATLIALYRVAQEALTNILRHAATEQARIQLALGGEQAALTVVDDGVGFDVERLNLEAGEQQEQQEQREQQEQQEQQEQHGLRGMRERMNLVGGTLSLHSAVGRGTRLVATAPRDAPSRVPGSPSRAEDSAS